MNIYALDSNIISYVLKDDKTVIERYREEAMNGNEFVMPPIVYFEVKCWLLERGAVKKQAEFHQMCKIISIGELNEKSLDIAAQLFVQARKRGKPVDNSDLLIAAFCLINDYTLITNNMRHFEDIDGLKLINWK